MIKVSDKRLPILFFIFSFFLAGALIGVTPVLAQEEKERFPLHLESAQEATSDKTSQISNDDKAIEIDTSTAATAFDDNNLESKKIDSLPSEAELIFYDSNSDRWVIDGTLKIPQKDTRFSDPEIKEYIIYWGNGEQKHSNSPMAHIPNKGEKLVADIDDIDIPRQPTATHFLIYGAYKNGTEKFLASERLVDQGDPFSGVELIFQDTDDRWGKVAGDLLIKRATDESDYYGYAIYWATDYDKKRIKNPIVILKKTGKDLKFSLIRGTDIPTFPQVKYLMVTLTNKIGKRRYEEVEVAKHVYIHDKGAPMPAKKVSFHDKDPRRFMIEGKIEITPSKNDEFVNEYVLYWGLNETTKRSEVQIGTLRQKKSGEKLTFKFPHDTEVPMNPRPDYILVYSKKGNQELAWGAAYQFHDVGSPVLINAGTFKMGNNKGLEHEQPARRVTLSNKFYIMDHEVTAGEFRECVNAGACNYIVRDNQSTFYGHRYKECEGSDGCNYAGHQPKYQTYNTKGAAKTFAVEGKESHPINYVNWYDTLDYANWLSLKERRNYRLCSEAEWEYAARSGTTTKRSCGDSKECLDSVAWYSYTSSRRPHAVQQKKPNQWGLYDMYGNVNEWVGDWFDDYNEDDLIDPKGPEGGKWKVMRGGNFFIGYDAVRAAYRGRLWPGYRSLILGFRLCADTKPFDSSRLMKTVTFEKPVPASRYEQFQSF